MKLYSVTIVLVIIFLGITTTVNNAFSQKYSKKSDSFLKSTITYNGLSSVFDKFELSSETQIEDDNTTQSTFHYSSFEGWTGFGLNGVYRWYFLNDSEMSMEGLAGGVMMGLSLWEYENTDQADFVDDSNFDDGGFGFGIGAQFSYKILLVNFIVIEPTLEYFHYLSKPEGLEPKGFAAGLNLGFAW